jgi:hypothetical protein
MATPRIDNGLTNGNRSGTFCAVTRSSTRSTSYLFCLLRLEEKRDRGRGLRDLLHRRRRRTFEEDGASYYGRKNCRLVSRANGVGPRALENRSILGDPRNAGIKDVLNAKIKRRESFGPFALSNLREAAAEWFETDYDVPFMMKVFQVRAKYCDMIPAVIHVDGTGRLQTVHKETNPALLSPNRTFPRPHRHPACAKHFF